MAASNINRILTLLLMTISSPTRAFSAPQPAVTAKSDLVVVGCGVLGISLCKQLLSHPNFASRTVTAITKSTGRHEAILSQVLGGNDNSSVKDGDKRFQLMTMDDALSQYAGNSFKDVIFCAPPLGI